jgi:hypothetical protein
MFSKTIAAVTVFAIYACSMFLIAGIPENTLTQQSALVGVNVAAK